jgi:hypothetical protein
LYYDASNFDVEEARIYDSSEEDSDDEQDSDSEEEPYQPELSCRERANVLEPGNVYDELVQNGNLFVLGSLVQKRKGWL